jgi:hypothetical protein
MTKVYEDEVMGQRDQQALFFIQMHLSAGEWLYVGVYISKNNDEGSVWISSSLVLPRYIFQHKLGE